MLVKFFCVAAAMVAIVWAGDVQVASAQSGFGTTTSQPFGNGWTHTGPSGRTTTSSPFGSGWIHRGQGGRTSTSMPFGNGWIHSR